MKKILLITIALFALINVTQAQRKGQLTKWLKIAPKAGIGSALLINSNSFQDKSIEMSGFNLSYNYGGSLGLGIGDYLNFYAEGNMADFSQKYHMQVQYTNGTDNSYDKTLNFQSTNLSVMMRWVSDLGGYFEIGPTFSTLKQASVENTTETTLFNPETKDFKDSYINLSVGFGQAVFRSERLYVFIGGRLNFSPESFYLPREDYPDYTYFRDGVYGSATGAGWVNNEANLLFDPEKHQIQGKTMPVTGFLTLEVNYIFGFWGNARCGRGRLMFFQ